jgi:hypothetical protein
MGNEIVKNYELPENETARAGFKSLWKIYPGQVIVDGQSKEVSVWILTKDSLPDYEPKIMEQLFRLMKKDLAIMKELKPYEGSLQVYEVDHPLSSLYLPAHPFPHLGSGRWSDGHRLCHGESRLLIGKYSVSISKFPKRSCSVFRL